MFQSLELRLRQSVALTPRVQQALRLLQLSGAEFEQEMREALDANPFLEEVEDRPAFPYDATLGSSQPLSNEAPGDSTPDLDDTRVTGDIAPCTPAADEDSSWADHSHCPTDVRDHLRDQLRLSQMGERDRALAMLIVDAIDDDGYFKADLADLAALILDEHDVESEDLLPALRFVQTLDPPGIAARSLQECLSVQLRALPDTTPGLPIALALVVHHIDLLARKDFGRLQHLLRCSERDIQLSRTLIRSLDPHPGQRFAPDSTRYVVPDVLVAKTRGQWTASLNPDAMPRIRINRAYAHLAGGRRRGAMAHQLQEARWLLRSVNQRFTTIHRVAQCIVSRQRGFLDYGDVAMKPLMLKEVADEVGLHASTICRVTNGKYMATPRGLFELKKLFSRQLATDLGGTCSTTAVRALMRELITNEDPADPLSDAQLARVLNAHGMKVARRTVTKYRTSMRMASVELRRALARQQTGTQASY